MDFIVESLHEIKCFINIKTTHNLHILKTVNFTRSMKIDALNELGH